MDNMAVKDFVKAKLAEVKVGYNIEDDTLLIEDEILDSLSILYLISELEKAYGITIPLGDVVEKNFGSPLIIESYVKGRGENGK